VKRGSESITTLLRWHSNTILKGMTRWSVPLLCSLRHSARRTCCTQGGRRFETGIGSSQCAQRSGPDTGEGRSHRTNLMTCIVLRSIVVGAWVFSPRIRRCGGVGRSGVGWPGACFGRAAPSGAGRTVPPARSVLCSFPSPSCLCSGCLGNVCVPAAVCCCCCCCCPVLLRRAQLGRWTDGWRSAKGPNVRKLDTRGTDNTQQEGRKRMCAETRAEEPNHWARSDSDHCELAQPWHLRSRSD
jgi:hypothetical protein